MSVWSNSPVIVIASLSFVGLVFAAGQWVGRVNAHTSTVSVLMNEIRQDIKKILGRLPPVVISRGSPLRLTGLGQSISNTLSGKCWARRTAPALVDRVRNKQPYEIQDICFSFMKKEFKPDKEWNAKLRICAYENGLEPDKVLEVLAIELRDELLEGKPPENLKSPT